MLRRPKVLFILDFFGLVNAFSCEVTLGIQCGHTACASSRNGLAVYMICCISRNENSFNVGFRSSRHRNNIPRFIHV